jgi:hypothetical protein
MKWKTKKYHVVETVPIFNRKIVTTIYNIGKIYTPNAQIHDPSLSWLGTGTSAKNDRVKLVLRAQIPL